MSCKKDADTNCCYWMGMPPSETGRTAAESERLEGRGITRLLKRSRAVPFLTYYIRTYKQLLHDNGIEFEDIQENWLREKPPSGPGIELMADFQVQQQQQQQNNVGGSRQSGKRKTKRRTHRKKGTRRRTKRYRTKTKRRRG